MCLKRGKLLTEDGLKKWENDKLLKEFSEDEIRKVLAKDPQSCLPFILPDAMIKIDENRLMSSYLTESLIKEIDRTHVDLGYHDLVNELKTFVTTMRGTL